MNANNKWGFCSTIVDFVPNFYANSNGSLVYLLIAILLDRYANNHSQIIQQPGITDKLCLYFFNHGT